ncbi:MAG: peptide deformylase, partial [Oscillospiraceae bacterium]|nr:peptide deformylase [Oscillospiraceae bacterium]
MIREIVQWDITSETNNPVLHEKTRPVADFTSEEVTECVRDLNDTLDELIRTEGNKRGAIGLSATQIGVDLAISAITFGETRYIFINPEIVEEKGRDRLFRIGCFSLYEYRALVRYNDDVVVKYWDENGTEHVEEFTGDRSCVLQHEMDHLEGLLLFDRLENKEEDLFVPREAVYKSGEVALKNRGMIAELRRKLNLTAPMSAEVYYSSLFNDYTDYVAFVEKEAEANAEFLQIIRKYVPDGGNILETGNGTGALSVWLAKQGYDVSCAEADEDLTALAEAINRQNGTNVKETTLPVDTLLYGDQTFDAVFSYEVLETLEDANLLLALDEGLRVGKYYIFLVPTIWNASNKLRGNEILKAAHSWQRFLVNCGYTIT